MFAPILWLNMRSAKRGCHNIVQSVLEDPEGLESGAFYRECRHADENAKLDAMKDEAERLWDYSAELTGVAA